MPIYVVSFLGVNLGISTLILTNVDSLSIHMFRGKMNVTYIVLQPTVCYNEMDNIYYIVSPNFKYD